MRKIGTKELINFSEYRKILDKDPDQAKNYTLYSQTFYVYNYADIDGVPAMKKEVTNTVSIPELTSLFLRFVDQQFTWKLCTTSCKIMRISLNQKSRIPRTSFSANCFAEYFAKKSGEDFPRLGGPGSFDQPKIHFFSRTKSVLCQIGRTRVFRPARALVSVFHWQKTVSMGENILLFTRFWRLCKLCFFLSGSYCTINRNIKRMTRKNGMIIKA